MLQEDSKNRETIFVLIIPDTSKIWPITNHETECSHYM